MKYIYASEIGLVRKENQDYLAVSEKDNAFFAVIGDGIGGAKAGSLASKMAVESIKESFEAHQDFSNRKAVKAWFHDAITKANLAVYRKSRRSLRFEGMGTTMIALILFNNEALAFNIGDSRVYAFSNEELKCLSHDQTFAYEMYLRNEISLQETETHPKRNILMNAVGIDRKIKYEVVEIPDNWEQILLSSDGLHSYVEHEKIEKILQKKSMSEKRQDLIEAAYQAGGFDNVSVILIEGDCDE